MANNYKIRVLMDTSSVDAASQKILKDTRQFATQWEKAAARAEAAIKRAYAAMGNVPGVGGGGGGGGGRGGTSGADKITIAQINSTGKVATAQINATGKVTAAQVSATGKVTAAGLAGNAKVTVAQTNSAAKVTAAQTAGNAKVTAAGLAGTAKVTSAQTAATASMTNAQVSAAAKVTTAQLSGTAKVTAAQLAGNAKVTSATIAGRAKIKAARISATRNRKRPPNAAQLATAQASIQAANTLAATQTQTARANAAQTIRTARAAGAAGTLSPQEVKAQIAAANSLANAEISAANRVAAVKVSAANQVAHAGASPGAQAAATLKANDKILAAETAAQAKIAAARTAGANQVTAAQNAAATKAAAAIKTNLTDVEVAEAAKNKLIDRTNKRRVKAATDALDTEKKGFLESVIAATSLGQAVTGVGGALLGLKVGHDLVVGLAKIMSDVQENVTRAADDIIRFSGELRILKSMTPDGEIEHQEQNLKIRQLSGMTEEKAVKYAEGARNILGRVPADDLDEAGRQQLIEQAAQTAARRSATSGDTEQQGKLLGYVTRYSKRDKNGKIDVDNAVAEFNAVAAIGEKGTQDPKKFAEEYAKVLSRTTSTKGLPGTFSTPRGAAVLTAFASGFAEQDTATKVNMISQVTHDFGNIRRHKGVNATADATLKAAKVLDSDNDLDAMIKMFGHVSGNLKPGESVSTAMKQFGFARLGSNRAFAQAFNDFDTGGLKDLIPMLDQPATFDAVDQQNRNFFKNDMNAQSNIAEANADAARIRAGRPFVDFRLAQKNAMAGYNTAELNTPVALGVESAAARAFGLGVIDPKAAILQQQALQDMRGRTGKTGNMVGNTALNSLTNTLLGPLNLFDNPLSRGANSGLGYITGQTQREFQELNKNLQENTAALRGNMNPAAPGQKNPMVPVPMAPRNGQPGGPFR